MKMIIISAPSGAGKTSITKFVLDKISDISFSVSATNRSPRFNEQNGIDYFFITTTEFKKRIEINDMLEWQMVYNDRYYGTLKSEIDKIYNSRKIPLLDLDVKGALIVKEKYPDSLSIFIDPPSVEELENRLYRRNTENEEGLRVRIQKAKYELTFKDKFDKIVINDDFTKACCETENIIKKYIKNL